MLKNEPTSKVCFSLNYDLLANDEDAIERFLPSKELQPFPIQDVDQGKTLASSLISKYHPNLNFSYDMTQNSAGCCPLKIDTGQNSSAERCYLFQPDYKDKLCKTQNRNAVMSSSMVPTSKSVA